MSKVVGPTSHRSAPEFRLSELISDAAIDAPADDKLNLDAVAATLESLVANADTPSNIAVFGAWGSGKTSLSRLVKARLSPNKRVRFVYFNAWKYAETPLRRHFLAGAGKELGEGEDYAKSLYSKRRTTKYSFGARTLRVLVAIAFASVGVALALVAAAQLLVWLPNPSQDYLSLIAASVASNAGALLVSTSLLAPVLTFIVNEMKVELDEDEPSSAEQFDRIFRELVEDHLPRDGRLVFFIDELDRAPARQMQSVLETLKTFLDQPGCVFVVAADQVVLERAISELEDVKVPGQGNPYYSAGSAYLDKIFHVQIYLPALEGPVLTQFAIELVERRSGVWEDLGGDRDNVISILVPAHVRSPRRVKVLLNNFAIASRIARARLGDAVLSAEQMRQLGKLVSLRTEFPLFYRNVEAHPSLVDAVTSHIVGDEAAIADYSSSKELDLLARAYAMGKEPVDVRLDPDRLAAAEARFATRPRTATPPSWRARRIRSAAAARTSAAGGWPSCAPDSRCWAARARSRGLWSCWRRSIRRVLWCSRSSKPCPRATRSAPAPPEELLGPRALRTLLEALFRVLFSYECVGATRIPATWSGDRGRQPSLVPRPDPALAARRASDPLHGLGEILRVPLLGALARLFGAFPVDVTPGQGRSAYDAAKRLIEAGELVGIFPEGKRSRAGWMEPELRAGAARLALETGAPLVPATIRGAYRAWPHFRRLPGFVRIQVRYHEPIDPAPFRSLPEDEAIVGAARRAAASRRAHADARRQGRRADREPVSRGRALAASLRGRPRARPRARSSSGGRTTSPRSGPATPTSAICCWTCCVVPQRRLTKRLRNASAAVFTLAYLGWALPSLGLPRPVGASGARRRARRSRLPVPLREGTHGGRLRARAGRSDSARARARSPSPRRRSGRTSRCRSTPPPSPGRSGPSSGATPHPCSPPTRSLVPARLGGRAELRAARARGARSPGWSSASCRPAGGAETDEVETEREREHAGAARLRRAAGQASCSETKRSILQGGLGGDLVEEDRHGPAPRPAPWRDGSRGPWRGSRPERSAAPSPP